MSDPASPAPRLPDRAQVVVVGGGIIGCSVAYHLAHAGWRDVVVLERHRLTAGTTWHAAGLIVSGGFHSETFLEMFKRSRHLYRDVLEAETGQATGYTEVGYLQVAATTERATALRRDANFQRLFGLESVEVSPGEIAELWPWARVDDLVCGFYAADQGRANPIDCARALANGAARRGVRFVEGVEVRDLRRRGARVCGVDTDHGPVEAEHVVCAAGLWSAALARRAGVWLPLQAAEHVYLVTEPLARVSRDLPVLEMPDVHAYLREESGGILVGLFEPEAAPWGTGPAGPPTDLPFATLEFDWDRLGPYVRRALDRLPALGDVGIRLAFCGPESFTPDLNPLVGEVPGCPGLWAACGLNSLGILLGGGLGELLAAWIVEGRPPTDVVELDVARVPPHWGAPAFLAERTREALGVLFGDAAWPNFAPRCARGARRSPLHDRLVAAGAHLTDVAGWEYPEWFGPTDGQRPSAAYTWGRPGWFGCAAAEHRAVRERVGLIDLSFMGKFWVQGPDAEAFLQRWAAADLAVPPGTCRYTVALDDDGRIRADVTVARHAPDRYLVVCGPETITRTGEWLRRACDEHPEWRVAVTDVTSAFAILNLAGPRARDLLARLSTADLSAEAFAYRTGRMIDVHHAIAWAQRMTYVGELGFELFVPTDLAVATYDAIITAGADVGLAHVGVAALDGLRLEKANRDYTHDVDNWDTPLEAGLAFTCAWDTPFRGREALAARRGEVPRRRLVQVLLDDPEPLLFGGEPLLRDGAPVGYVRAGAYGHTLGRAVGLAMVSGDEPVTPAWLAAGSWCAQVDAAPVPATVSLRPAYDPSGVRARS